YPEGEVLNVVRALSREEMKSPPRRVKSPCTKLRKVPCAETPNCQWIVGKGCHSEQKAQELAREEMKSPPRRVKSPCRKLRKADCAQSPDCHWIVGQGCHPNDGKSPPRRVDNRGSINIYDLGGLGDMDNMQPSLQAPEYI